MYQKERTATLSLTDEITIRIYGDNVTLLRSAWLEMLSDMRPECENYSRITARLRQN